MFAHAELIYKSYALWTTHSLLIPTMQPLQLSPLPEELLVKIFNLSVVLERDRAELAMVCKTWQQLVHRTRTSVYFNSSERTMLDAQLNWLNTVVKQRSPSMRKIKVYCFPGNTCVECHTINVSSTIHHSPAAVKSK